MNINAVPSRKPSSTQSSIYKLETITTKGVAEKTNLIQNAKPETFQDVEVNKQVKEDKNNLGFTVCNLKSPFLQRNIIQKITIYFLAVVRMSKNWLRFFVN